MAYPNTPGVKATYLDGSFRVPTGTTQPRILAIGPAASGMPYELYRVGEVRQAESEFGAATEIMKVVHESVAQGADNCAVMRCGGTQGSLVLTDSEGSTLTITPEYRDDEVMDRYALILDGTGSENRILVYDIEDEEMVYDSSELLILDTGIVEVTDTGLDLFSVGTLNDPTTYIAFADLVTGDFTAEGTATMTTVTATQGTDGQNSSLVERYAALNQAYHLLDYRDADFVIPTGVYVDDANVVDSGAIANFFKGVPVSGATNDELGYVWQYIYRGRIYTYFVDSSTYFTDEGTAAASTLTVNTDLVLTAEKTGVGGDGILIEIDDTGSAGPTVTISEPGDTTLKILVVDDGTSSTSDTVTAINTALDAYTMENGELASTLVQASGGGATTLVAVAEAPLENGAGGHVLTHEDLTGDSIPAAVSTAFAAGSDAQLREVNFGHQLASFLHRASTTWKTMHGSISFKGPDALSRTSVSDWVGNLPAYTLGPDGSQYIVDAPSDNGFGILGHKLLAGAADASGGYRNSTIVDAGSSVDGLAYGGFIKTVGASLPNASDFPDHSYGILSSDEALDANSAPVDIGKFISVTYDWMIHRNAYNGGTQYRGPVNATYIAKVATLPEKEEPIGPNGQIRKVTDAPRIHATQLDQLAEMRVVGVRRENGTGYTFVKTRTAAHPDSDYSKLSTIRSVNKHIQGIRNIARDYLGKEFSAQRLIALKDAIDVYLQAEGREGFNQGARCTFSYTRADKILGKIKIKLRMVPPFSMEEITIETSMAADESEL